ncbi:uncharacterized protein L969DRAFT_51108 [Mixia osmundae IAM 14324]|uniref:3-oxoacyl-[acyl-carrier-protein] reductase n=1 Tax=Mixia osmundae (strain CBS 9802 / IAM 14324 / JCM 22182 / KY 12970) TaxID=764103 RepID=G7DZ17_MIXOS|nr:uncharacterized protein L969DRAFT_51108 [Mixia osmundae IAM 14324]KEI38229.1 hypothetical protein L969DRAFT_51108 [Mixia osmundae IAM 14324]GAA95827.1 hypothetical protein E5Q_02484 [Mixia osmundae IAM 14324]
MASAAARLSNVTGHLSASFPTGLLAGEVAIITGAAQGIGRCAALMFAKEGAKVVVSDLDGEKAQKVVEEIKANGGEAIAVGGDVTAEDFPKKIIKTTVDKYGKINHLVTNAGFTYDKMSHTMTDAQFELMLKVHNTAPFRLIREAAPYFRIKDHAKRENRSITNVSSTSGLHGNAGQVNYAVAKSGVLGLSKTIAKEWGPFGVRCNTIAFGYISTRLTADKGLGAAIEVNGEKVALGIPGGASSGQNDRTSMIPLQRPGAPEEAAAGMLFLASPLAAYVTGHCLEVTGGR